MSADDRNPATHRAPLDWGAWLSLQTAVGALLGLIATVIWSVTTGGYYWPAWVWLGFGAGIALQLGIRGAIRATRGRQRGLAITATVLAVTWSVELVVWLLTGRGFFWPIWSLLGYSAVLTIYALVVIRLLPPERERELVERVDELTRTRRGALDVQAAELRRIERDLHDGAQARLVALSMQLGRAEERVADNPEAAALLRQARGEASAAIAELRDLARGIAPPVLADRGLGAAVEALAGRVAIPVTVDVAMDGRPVPVHETAAYFVVAEALTNVAKHAPAAEARVTIVLDPERLLVEVADDGPGGADSSGGGLTGLRHRVEALDGTLEVVSHPGKGTTIHAELPCES